MHLPVLLGTARIGRRSEAVAKKTVQILKEMQISTELIDVRDYPMSATDNTGESNYAKKWKEIIEKSIGFILVSPEYNRGYPGELKMFLDQLYWEYKHKVVLIVSVSNGPWGGTRMAEIIRPTLNTFSMIVLGPAIHVSNINELINEEGQFNSDRFDKSLRKSVTQLIELGDKLQT